jgi:hypothetical protein
MANTGRDAEAELSHLLDDRRRTNWPIGRKVISLLLIIGLVVTAVGIWLFATGIGGNGNLLGASFSLSFGLALVFTTVYMWVGCN